MVLSIAGGRSLKGELQQFMYAMNQLLEKVDKESAEPHWFIEGMMAITQQLVV